ncbi:MAG: molybdopterin molybdotransferase MoeA [Rhodocyclaceae bacterium]|nr:molybdopterin molybdotransferase MoeA [Rhodocyclaceae bacterium]MCC7269676.1 molybdopterin molybdotransferase MoeA [Rhodocyclaceae bacterium]
MSLLSFDDALQKLLAAARPLAEVEEVDTVAAAGRVLAHAQASGLAVPPLDNSAMDGYAVRLADVAAPGTRLPVAQRIPAGSVGTPLAAGTAARIFTGAPVPEGAEAVVMQELCEHAGEGVVQVNHVPRAGENIRRAGEDIRRGAELLAAGTRLAPQDTGLAASVGLAKLPVFRRLRVALFSTGDELAMPGEALKPGGIYNSNRYTLRGLLGGLGCEVEDLGIVRDTLEATRAALREAAAAADVVITCGGVSVGEEDHVKAAVQAEGALELWKIAIKPGKPLAFGKVSRRGTATGETTATPTAPFPGKGVTGAGGQGPRGEEAAFIGLPGNPVSAFVTFLMLVRPYLLACMGARATAPRGLAMRADFDWPKPDRRREFLRVRINGAGGLDLFPNQGSGVLTSCAWADGLADIAAGQAVARGEAVRFLPFSELLY